MDVVQDRVALGLVEALDSDGHRAVRKDSLESRHRGNTYQGVHNGYMALRCARVLCVFVLGLTYFRPSIIFRKAGENLS